MTKTVQVRVAVAVAPDGNWSALSDYFTTEREAVRTVLGMVPKGATLHWLTATLPIPEVQEVEASVEEGE